MGMKRQKCPVCSTRLKMVNGIMTCPECGYYLRDSTSDSSPYNGWDVSNEEQDSGYGVQGGYGQQTYEAGQNVEYGNQDGYGQSASGTGRQKSAGYKTASPRKERKVINGKRRKMVLVVVIIIAVNCITYFLSAIHSYMDYHDSIPAYSVSEEQNHLDTDLEDGGWSSWFSGEASSGPDASGENQQDIRYPEEELFQELLSYIFQKPYTLVTEEEIAGITGLGIDSIENEITYQVDGEEAVTLTYSGNTWIDLEDLQCFPGLEHIYLSGKQLWEGDLDGLDRLCSVYSENSIEELARIIPHPELITELGTSSSYSEEGLEGIESFPNLQYLSVDYYYLQDISALEQFPNLQGLVLEECDSLTDYSLLYNLTNLRELSIESIGLKDIDFVRQMPDLTYFSVERSGVGDIAAITACPNLTELYFIDNYSVLDYTPVGELEHLVNLDIHVGGYEEYKLPSFKKLTELEYLSLGDLEDLSLLSEVSGITRLYLEDCYVEDLPGLLDLPLEELSLEGTYVYGDMNMEEIFGIPTLQALNLDYFSGKFDFDKLPDNEALWWLSMNYTAFRSEDTWEADQVLSDHYDLFTHFPGLESLSVKSMDIDSIDFVQALPRLRYLDITDNHVTSLKPLEQLEDFQSVLCGMNDITESVSEESGIYVDTTSW